MFGRKSKRERERVLNGLLALRVEYATSQYPFSSHAARVVDDYIFYLTVGRDRKKLGMEWVEQCRKQIEDGARLMALG